ncbi:hypothetical protein H4R18_000177 [Coemansia javaensis]|uniref:Small ribosomal subunit protein mS29 n=1 Tax=Coemansia javaensis TaxID=2761396 RepID=A0A9W8HJ09_9FUNG|nr:hypothetical protein H4R18_000177 [Coemansia javaensis]
MLRGGRAIGRLAGRGVRLASTTQGGRRTQGADRTQSTAFKKKDDDQGKRLKIGTTTAVNMATANPTYYAARPNPKLETLGAQSAIPVHVNKVMAISTEFLECLGEGRCPGQLGTDFGLFGKPALLYRALTQELVDRLARSAAEAGPKRAAVLDGRGGTGKSAELLKLASVGAAQGHLVVYVHSATPWVNSSRPYAPDGGDGGMFVQQELAAELLATVGTMSRAALEAVPLGRSVALGKRQLEASGTLADLVDAGIRAPALAQDAVDALLDVASTQTSVPVLLAVDDVNALWCNSMYRDQEDAVLPARRLRLVHALLPFFEGGRALARGWAVGATSHTDARFMPRDLKLRLDPPPAVPLANAALAADPAVVRPATELPFDVVKVGRLSSTEAWALMEFYHQTSIVASPVTEALVAKNWIIASGNPREMFASVTSFS